MRGLLAADGRAIVELSTENGVRHKAARPNSWYPAVGGLFAEGRHLVLYESQWDKEAHAAIERWSVIEDDANVARYETTTWLLSDPFIDRAIATSGLRVLDRFGDPGGSTHAPDADLQTLVVGTHP